MDQPHLFCCPNYNEEHEEEDEAGPLHILQFLDDVCPGPGQEDSHANQGGDADLHLEKALHHKEDDNGPAYQQALPEERRIGDLVALLQFGQEGSGLLGGDAAKLPPVEEPH